jgi:hypothetical protein
VRLSDDPVLLTIPARFGHFYPQSATHVGFATSGRGPTARKLASLPYVTITQEASDGYNLAFPAGRFNEVARIARPNRRRQLSPEHRERLIAAGAATRILPKHGATPQKSGQIPVAMA